MALFSLVSSGPLTTNLLRVTLACGSFKLLLDKNDEVLWIGPEKTGSPVEISAYTELWGFGSGAFAQNNDTCLDFGTLKRSHSNIVFFKPFWQTQNHKIPLHNITYIGQSIGQNRKLPTS